jgi:hypothetical protein
MSSRRYYLILAIIAVLGSVAVKSRGVILKYAAILEAPRPVAGVANYAEPERAALFASALSDARDALMAHKSRVGYLPDITSGADWTLEAGERIPYSRDSFARVTGGGRLIISAISDGQKTARLAGVVSGDLMNDPEFRAHLVYLSKNGGPDMRKFDADPYDGRELAVFITLY